MTTLKVTMMFEVNPEHIDTIKKIEHHADWLLDLESWPEVKSVHDVHVEKMDFDQDKWIEAETKHNWESY